MRAFVFHMMWCVGALGKNSQVTEIEKHLCGMEGDPLSKHLPQHLKLRENSK